MLCHRPVSENTFPAIAQRRCWLEGLFSFQEIFHKYCHQGSQELVWVHMRREVAAASGTVRMITMTRSVINANVLLGYGNM